MIRTILILGMFVLNMGTVEAKTIELSEKNTVVLRGPVTSTSVANAQVELAEKARAGKVLYLALDTPGGDVDAGNQLIDTIHALPGKVHTVTVFAASMGFHIVQNAGSRYITPSGTLMSHRAKLSGASGEVPGELLTRLAHTLRMLTRMDLAAARRMGRGLKQYQDMIRDEYWVSGPDAVADKAADEVVTVRCAGELNTTRTETLVTIFGAVKLTMSKCPLVAGPLKVDFEQVEEAKKTEVGEYIGLMFNNRTEFVSKYIRTGEWKRFQ